MEGFAPPLPTYLCAVDLGMPGTGGVRRGQADDEQALLGQLGRFGESLSEGELGLEAATREIGLIVKHAGIGYPLVNEDEARCVVVEQLPQSVTRACGPLIVGADPLVSLSPPQLPRQLSLSLTRFGGHKRLVSERCPSRRFKHAANASTIPT